MRQLPGIGARPGRRVLIRTDGAGYTHTFLEWITRRLLGYSIGYTLPDDFEPTLRKLPANAWSPA